MSGNKIETVNVTRNQSTAQYTFEHTFLGNNRYDEITFTNNTEGSPLTLRNGDLVIKTGASEYGRLNAASNIANVVGIVRLDNEVVIEASGTLDVNICTVGLIAEEQIQLPDGITLETVIPTTPLSLRNRLNELGFSLEGSVENTKFDNA